MLVLNCTDNSARSLLAKRNEWAAVLGFAIAGARTILSDVTVIAAPVARTPFKPMPLCRTPAMFSIYCSNIIIVGALLRMSFLLPFIARPTGQLAGVVPIVLRTRDLRRYG